MNESLRRALFVSALVAIAGCSGGLSSQTASLPSQGAVAFVHRGVPFGLPAFHTAVRPETGGYPTKKSLVFEGDQEEEAVNIYQTANLSSNPAAIATIHVSAGCPYGLAVDKKGTIYVADNCGGNDVEEYPKGSTTIKTKITDGISNPLGLAIDKSGTLYASNYPASITEYAYGTTTPIKTISGSPMEDPFGLALDAKGNLYIADFGASAVFELPAGGSSVTNLNLQDLGEPLGLAIDQKTGYLWETAGSGNVINIYQIGGSTSPIETIDGNGYPYAISLQLKGKPKAEVVESDIDTKAVYAYKPGSYTSYATLTNGVELPTGLLITTP
jgi:DNA-binding beta-propeller fold protein YncE